MLCRLHVINYALIDDVKMEFGPGLNIITGETGAGKSILIGALGLVLGMRASSDVIRTGEDRCTVEAIFELPPGHACLTCLEDMGVEGTEGELILRREVLAGGRSRCYANGLAIPARSLQVLGRSLVDLHGQHEHQSLLDVDRHLDYLDGFGGLEDRVREVRKVHDRLAALQRRRGEWEAQAQRLRERWEILTFQVEEIAAANPEANEDEALDRERSVLANAERLTESAAELETMLYQGDDSIADRLGTARHLLEAAARMDGSLEPRVEELDALCYGVEELSRFLTDYARTVEYNPERLAEVTERLELLGRLKKKYGGDLESVLAYRKQAAEELARSEEVDASLGAVDGEIEEEVAALSERCAKLSEAREKATRRLSKQIQVALGDLGMPHTEFRVELTRHEGPDGVVALNGRRYDAGPRGIEEAEFHLSTNPGEAVRALVRVASGGEISRIMLAMKTVLSRLNSVQVLIFDEIDIGISGRIAEVVGRKLKELSHTYQTVSITHLPQIAKMADLHFSVRKQEAGKRTVTRVLKLDDEARTEELAKLLGGEEISPVTMEHAREMLKQG